MRVHRLAHGVALPMAAEPAGRCDCAVGRTRKMHAKTENPPQQIPQLRTADMSTMVMQRR